MTQKFKPIPGFPNYEIDKRGRVYSKTTDMLLRQSNGFITLYSKKRKYTVKAVNLAKSIFKQRTFIEFVADIWYTFMK